MKTRFWFMTALVLAAASMRLFPHPPNFAPITAMALFGGAHFDRRSWAFLVPLAAMLLSDAALELLFGWGFHAQMLLVYGSFAAIVAIGLWLRPSRTRVLPVTAAALGASLLFFMITNLGVWATGTLYPHTTSGLLACYTAAIPFFKWTVTGDLFYTAVFFGGFALAERHIAALAPAVRARG